MVERRKPETAISGFQDELQSKPEAQDTSNPIRFSGNIQDRMLKLISVFCRWCNAGFCICQSCWRGHAYCSLACRRAGYLKCRRQAQHRYRQTEKGKKAHRLAENRRRHPELYPDSKNMDDATTKRPSNMPIEMPRQRNSADFHLHFRHRCQFCGRWGEIVAHFPRRKWGTCD